MKISIEKKALQTMLNSMLGCVNAWINDEIIKEYSFCQDREIIDFGILLKIADKEKSKTPFHVLFDFCSYSQDIPDDFTITHNDVIRLFCTQYHMNANKGILNPMIVNDIPSFLISHMLLPVLISQDNTGGHATYMSGDKSIQFRNIFLPSEVEIQDNTYYALHLGTAVTSLAKKQVGMIEAHLNLSKDFCFLIEDVDEVDFTNFQHYGNYQKIITSRFRKYSSS